MCSVGALHLFFLQCQCRLLSCVPHCEDGIEKHLKGDFLLLFTQVRRFLFLTNSWLQSLYSSILSLLLPSVFIPRNPKQGGKSSISAENHLGRHAWVFCCGERRNLTENGDTTFCLWPVAIVFWVCLCQLKLHRCLSVWLHLAPSGSEHSVVVLPQYG